MASVTSLDKDLAQMRLSKYTPQAANEVREWIREILGASAVGDADLMEELKSGVVLCRLVNKLVPGSAKFKDSAMPFVQMENISLFLRILSMPPLSLSPHDLFLTVDLYESKDPAQVLQTIQAFSRKASAQDPHSFPVVIGPRTTASGMTSPTQYGTKSRFISPNSTGNSNSKGKPPVPPRSAGVSSWSKPTDEYSTAPAWNIHQYGYMGGASQGNQNVVMGGRRQITSAGPSVPTLKEKEERRKREAETDRAGYREEADEKRARAEEEAAWERQAEEDRKKYKIQEEQAEQSKREREAKEAEEKNFEKIRLERMHQESERRVARERQEREDREKHEAKELERRRQTDRIEYSYKGVDSKNLPSDFGGQNSNEVSSGDTQRSESQRIKELERELELAREREKQYQLERERRETQALDSAPVNDEEDERDFLKHAWAENKATPQRPLPIPASKPQSMTEPKLPHATLAAQRQRQMQDEAEAEESAENNPPPSMPPRETNTSTPPGAGTRWGSRWAGGSRIGSVVNRERNGSGASGAGLSIVQREMELERQKQREWEMNQQQLQEDRSKMTDKEKADDSPAWDVNQYGYMKGANQGTEQVAFGAKRQIIGPRAQR